MNNEKKIYVAGNNVQNLCEQIMCEYIEQQVWGFELSWYEYNPRFKLEYAFELSDYHFEEIKEKMEYYELDETLNEFVVRILHSAFVC